MDNTSSYHAIFHKVTAMADIQHPDGSLIHGLLLVVLMEDTPIIDVLTTKADKTKLLSLIAMGTLYVEQHKKVIKSFRLKELI